jgi:DNA-binding response OmpR family regulator
VISADAPASARGRVLLVDDEPAVLAGLNRHLRRRFDVVTATGAAEGLAAIDAADEPFDVVVSDLRMPGMDGIQFLAAARDRSPGTARMLLTGHADVDSAVDAVNRAGLFRFLLKPCPPDELLVELDDALAHVRRTTRPSDQQPPMRGAQVQGSPSTPVPGEVVRHGELAGRTVKIAGTDIDLTRREFDLLAFLAASPGRVFSREDILRDVWHSRGEWQDPATVTEHVRRVRQKLSAADGHDWIVTSRGVGYRFVP